MGAVSYLSGKTLVDTQSTIFRLNEIPEDIARRILEFAALEDPQLASSLVLVSRKFRRWFNPIKFETISVRGDRVPEFNAAMRESADNFRHIRTLALRIPEITDVDWEALLTACTGVRSIHIDEFHIRSLGQISKYPDTLTQLVVTGWLFRVQWDSTPALSSLTHLVLVDDVLRSLPDASNFPNLTHFSCRYRYRFGWPWTHYECPEDVEEGLNRVLQAMLSCKKLKLAIVVLFSEEKKEVPGEEEIRSTYLQRVAHHLTDPRVVLHSANKYGLESIYRDWDLFHEGSLWKSAERRLGL